MLSNLLKKLKFVIIMIRSVLFGADLLGLFCFSEVEKFYQLCDPGELAFLVEFWVLRC